MALTFYPLSTSSLQPIKNPQKTFINPLSNPSFPPSTTMSSWPCPKCTFLNPPSQKSTCQICHTPSISSSSSSPSKWACKACTFLNSYTLSNCEICDTRASFSSLFDSDVDISGSSSVGSIFYPLRRCNTTRVQDPCENSGLGFNDKVRTEMGHDHVVDQGVQLGGSRNFSSKRKFHDPVLENADALHCFDTNKKEESAIAVKGLVSAKSADNAEGSVTYTRKLHDLADFVEKPMKTDGFRDVKSTRKAVSVLAAVNGFGMEKLGSVETLRGSVCKEIAENAEVKKVSGVVKILSYNVWFREDLEVHKRMQAIGDLIELHSPDVICFQEVTPNIYGILQKSMWWKQYCCSVSYERAASETYFCMQLAKLPVKSFNCKQFSYTAMARELCIAQTEVNDKSLVIATTHLESPCPGPPTWDQMYSKERVNQAKEAITFLCKYPNVIFCGDMNWDDKLDGHFPFVEGWFDAWEKLRSSEIGWTYDTKSNKMLTGNRTLQKRLDRFICHLTDFEISCIEMIGTEPIPGLTYCKQKKMKNKIQELMLPVLPSDHYGLLVTITTR